MSVSTIPIYTRDQVREFLLGLGLSPARIEEGLQDQHGILFRLGGDQQAAFMRDSGDPTVYEFIEDVDRLMDDQGEKRMSTPKPAPVLIVGPVLVSDGPPPRGPQRAKSLTESILERSGTYLVKQNPRPFYGTDVEIADHVAATLAANPGARLSNSVAETPAKALSQKLDRVTGAKSGVDGSPTVLIATKAAPVERPKIAGVLDRSVIRAERAASEAQAEAVMDRIRAKQAADPELKASAQRSDGSFYGPDGSPHENLSMSRQPADRDRAPGVGPAKIRLSELRPVERKLVEGVERRECEVNFCTEVIYSKTRKRCADHAMTDRGQGIKGK